MKVPRQKAIAVRHTFHQYGYKAKAFKELPNVQGRKEM
jgi:hypothetical protein